MTLEELITALEAADPTLVLPHGFTNPHSYRGFYEDLAFEPATDVLVADMLADARDALGETFEGWKGGQYKMRRGTDCWLAEEGHLGETLGPLLLHFMLAAGVRDAARQAAGQAVCRHPEAYEGECPCPTDCGCCKPAPAVGQPAEAQPAEAHPPRTVWRIEWWRKATSKWLHDSPSSDSQAGIGERLARTRECNPGGRYRLVRETTTWTVEDETR